MIQALAAQGRNDSYLKKLEIGTTLNEINSEMKRLTTAFPALSRIPSINMDAMSNPKVKTPPGVNETGIPMGLPVPSARVSGQIAQPAGGMSVSAPSGSAASQAVMPNMMMPLSERTRMFSDGSDQNVDPYLLAKSGVMVQPTPFSSGSRFASPNLTAWKMDQPSSALPGAVPPGISMSSLVRSPTADGNIQYPTMIGDNGVGPFRGPVQNMPLPYGPPNYTPEQQYYLQLLQMSPDGSYGDFLRSKLGEKRY
jgi:hypothetical protein